MTEAAKAILYRVDHFKYTTDKGRPYVTLVCGQSWPCTEARLCGLSAKPYCLVAGAFSATGPRHTSVLLQYLMVYVCVLVGGGGGERLTDSMTERD